MEREALTLALEALEGFYDYGYDRRECFEHITAIKAALAQPAIDPVHEYRKGFIAGQIDMRDRPEEQPAQEPESLRDAVFTVLEGFTLPHDVRKMLEAAYYTTSPKRPWVGLTAEDFSAIKFSAEMRFPAEFRAGARWADTKLKEKNT